MPETDTELASLSATVAWFALTAVLAHHGPTSRATFVAIQALLNDEFYRVLHVDTDVDGTLFTVQANTRVKPDPS